jgi:hypothetical protein
MQNQWLSKALNPIFGSKAFEPPPPPKYLNLKHAYNSDWVSFLAYPNLFGIKDFVVVVAAAAYNSYFLIQIAFWKKANLVFLFFLLRKLILPFYSFTLFCIILPMTMFVPEAELPAWVVCYVPATMSVLNILPAPRSFPFMIPYLLFENTMSVTKFHAMVSGLFQLPSSFEWVVTKKSGRSSDGDLVNLMNGKKDAPEKEKEAVSKSKKKKKHNRMYRKELMLAFLLLTASVRSLLSAQGIHFYFLLFQGISFLLVGLDLIGEQVD